MRGAELPNAVKAAMGRGYIGNWAPSFCPIISFWNIN